MRHRRIAATGMLLVLCCAVAAVVWGQGGEIVNPDGVTYDPKSGRYYDRDGSRIQPPPVPPFLSNRGWRRGPSGELLDPNGQVTDPSSLYPPPDGNVNPTGVSYDPATGKYYDGAGQETSYPDLPDFMHDRGYQQDVRTGRILDPDGNEVDLTTFYPAPDFDSGLRYDPTTKKYYGANGQESPPFDLRRMDEGWTHNPATGQWIDPQGKTHDPSTLYPAPDPLSNHLGLSYDPVSGKYFDSEGRLVPGDLPQFMKDQGYRIDAAGRITDPTGARVDPTTIFDEPEANPRGYTYDPETGFWYDSIGQRASMPDLPPYMAERGYRLDHRSGEIVDPDGKVNPPSSYYPAPSGGLGLTYDPQTGKYYAGSREAPPRLPDYMQDRGWNYDPRTNTFLDPNNKPVQPSTLFPPAYPYPLPSAPPSPPAAPAAPPTPGNPGGGTSLGPGPPDQLWGAPVNVGPEGLVDFGGTSFPADGSLALSPVGGMPFTNAPLDDAGGYVNLDPSSLNVPSALSAGRSGDVQLMILMEIQATVPGSGRARAGGRVASLSARLPAQPESGPPLKASLESLGVSSGPAFRVALANEEAYPVEIAAAGVVVEPLRPGDGGDVVREHARMGGGRSEVTADAYCLEYEREPPPQGMLFRVAGPEIQRRFQPMRAILRAARKLLDEGGLTPDSDPEQYFHAIVQWALWTKERGFDAESFADAFVDRTRKNFQAAGQRFTRDIEATVRALAPNRWRDIERVAGEAAALSP